jgi:hypothetical protein
MLCAILEILRDEPRANGASVGSQEFRGTYIGCVKRKRLARARVRARVRARAVTRKRIDFSRLPTAMRRLFRSKR